MQKKRATTLQSYQPTCRRHPKRTPKNIQIIIHLSTIIDDTRYGNTRLFLSPRYFFFVGWNTSVKQKPSICSQVLCPKKPFSVNVLISAGQSSARIWNFCFHTCCE